MVYVPILVAALVVGLALGGRLGALLELRLRALWLFYAALCIQIVAFPWDTLPWEMGDEAAKWLWLGSYCCLVCAAFLNMRLPGVAVIAAGMLSNLAAIIANGGHMPALPAAAKAAGLAPLHMNSATMPDPSLGWLVDRWAAPDWLPLANVYSVGDVLLVLGGVVLLFHALQVPLLHARRRAPQVALLSPPPLPLEAPPWLTAAAPRTVARPAFPAAPPPWPRALQPA